MNNAINFWGLYKVYMAAYTKAFLKTLPKCYAGGAAIGAVMVFILKLFGTCKKA